MFDKELFQPLSVFRQTRLALEITIVDRHLKVFEIYQGDVDICFLGNARSQGCELFVCRRGPRASGEHEKFGHGFGFLIQARGSY